jgi:hypothetical protein
MQTPFAGSGMPNQVDDALLHAMFGREMVFVQQFQTPLLAYKSPWAARTSLTMHPQRFPRPLFRRRPRTAAHEAGAPAIQN